MFTFETYIFHYFERDITKAVFGNKNYLNILEGIRDTLNK
jgi:hypothetical protein